MRRSIYGRPTWKGYTPIKKHGKTFPTKQWNFVNGEKVTIHKIYHPEHEGPIYRITIHSLETLWPVKIKPIIAIFNKEKVEEILLLISELPKSRIKKWFYYSFRFSKKIYGITQEPSR